MAESEERRERLLISNPASYLLPPTSYLLPPTSNFLRLSLNLPVALADFFSILLDEEKNEKGRNCFYRSINRQLFFWMQRWSWDGQMLTLLTIINIMFCIYLGIIVKLLHHPPIRIIVL